ncbi:MAG: PQQ-dependent dehydrogenase, methanol/ethanol family, partial [Erythrobacter sp.]|nr:PQQ-dependent dehydrogenase, methanol/ethanol family [Erythrobacter sp.]
MRVLTAAFAGLLALSLPACSEQETMTEGGIDMMRLVNAGEDEANWITHGRTYSEQRFSPLTQVGRENVSELGLAWY